MRLKTSIDFQINRKCGLEQQADQVILGNQIKTDLKSNPNRGISQVWKDNIRKVNSMNDNSADKKRLKEFLALNKNRLFESCPNQNDDF